MPEIGFEPEDYDQMGSYCGVFEDVSLEHHNSIDIEVGSDGNGQSIGEPGQEDCFDVGQKLRLLLSLSAEKEDHWRLLIIELE